MANEAGKLFFSADVDYQITLKDVAKKMNRVMNTLEDSGMFKLKFKVDPDSLKLIEKQLKELGLNPAGKSASQIKDMDAYVNRVGTNIGKIQSQLTQFKDAQGVLFNGNTFTTTDVSANLNSINSLTKAYSEQDIELKQKVAIYEELKRQMAAVNAQMQNLRVVTTNTNKETTQNTRSEKQDFLYTQNQIRLRTELTNTYNKHGAAIKHNTKLYEEYLEVQRRLKLSVNDGGYASRDEATRAVDTLKEKMAQANVHVDSLRTRLKKMFSLHFNTTLVMGAIHALTQALRDIIETVTQVDSAMAQLKIVSGEADGAIDRFANKAFQAAQKVGKSAIDIMSSTETWARLGYSLDDSLQLAETTSMFSNVADTDIESATSSLTAILKGFSSEYGVDDAEHIADILASVGEHYAISASELGEGLQEAGASMEAANNTFEQSVALLAAGNAAVQDSSKVATALKTTTMRIRGATADLEDAGEEVDEFCESTAKMRDEVLALSGVDIMEVDGETFRSTYDILLDIAKVYNSLSDVNQAGLLELISGKRNASVIKSVITNVNDLTGAYEDAQNAVGTITEANSIYLDTIEGKQQQFTATWQKFATEIMNSDFIKGAVDTGSGLLGFLTALNGFSLTNNGVFQILTALGTTALLGKDKGRPKRRVNRSMPIYIKKVA